MIDVAGGNAVYYYHFDGLGSVAALSNVNQEIVETYDYDAFGQPTIRNAADVVITQSAYDNPYFFTSRRLDNETGLYYYRARHYDPETGRFLQTDPIGYAGGLNLYAYCGNDPINWIDPYGLFRFGKRPLKGGKARWHGTGPLSNYFNVETVHEHGFFEDGSGDNVGFFDDSTVRSEDPTGRGYRYGRKHYDDDLMREALKNVQDGEYSLRGKGKEKKNNCQDWASRLRREYRRLEKERKRSGKKCK